jgi:hypothetical protein
MNKKIRCANNAEKDFNHRADVVIGMQYRVDLLPFFGGILRLEYVKSPVVAVTRCFYT